VKSASVRYCIRRAELVAISVPPWSEGSLTHQPPAHHFTPYSGHPSWFLFGFMYCARYAPTNYARLWAGVADTERRESYLITSATSSNHVHGPLLIPVHGDRLANERDHTSPRAPIEHRLGPNRYFWREIHPPPCTLLGPQCIQPRSSYSPRISAVPWNIPFGRTHRRGTF